VAGEEHVRGPVVMVAAAVDGKYETPNYDKETATVYEKKET